MSDFERTIEFLNSIGIESYTHEFTGPYYEDYWVPAHNWHTVRKIVHGICAEFLFDEEGKFVGVLHGDEQPIFDTPIFKNDGKTDTN